MVTVGIALVMVAILLVLDPLDTVVADTDLLIIERGIALAIIHRGVETLMAMAAMVVLEGILMAMVAHLLEEAIILVITLGIDTAEGDAILAESTILVENTMLVRSIEWLHPLRNFNA